MAITMRWALNRVQFATIIWCTSLVNFSSLLAMLSPWYSYSDGIQDIVAINQNVVTMVAINENTNIFLEIVCFAHQPLLPSLVCLNH